MRRPLRIALLATDSREHFKEYDNPHPYFGTAPQALIEGFAQCPEIEVHVISCIRKPMRAPEKLANNIWYHGLYVPKSGWMQTLYLGCIRAVRRKLRELKPDIVHGQGTERDCAITAVFSGFPNVLTIHGNMRAIARHFHARPLSFHWLTARLETIALRKATGVICNSAYTEEQVRPLARRTWRVPNALASDFFHPPTAERSAEAVLLNVGNLVAYKNQLELLNLAKSLHERGLQFRLDFIGAINRESDYGRRFLAALAPAQSAGWARHLGTLSRAELITHLDSAHALVHVATEESFGLAVAEALARNLRLFAFLTGGIADITAGIPDVTLTPPLDWPALATAIESWLHAGGPPAQDISQSMHLRYSQAPIAYAHMEIYREILARPPAA